MKELEEMERYCNWLVRIMVRDCRDDDAGDREMADAAMVCTEETAGETPMCGCQSCTPCQLSGGGFGL